MEINPSVLQVVVHLARNDQGILPSIADPIFPLVLHLSFTFIRKEWNPHRMPNKDLHQNLLRLIEAAMAQDALYLTKKGRGAVACMLACCIDAAVNRGKWGDLREPLRAQAAKAVDPLIKRSVIWSETWIDVDNHDLPALFNFARWWGTNKGALPRWYLPYANFA